MKINLPAMENGHETIIRLRDLSKDYQSAGESIHALRGIDLDVRQGEFLVITGKSGAGKTTLVNCLTRLDRNTSGEIYVQGQAIHNMPMEEAARWRGRNVGIVFQTFELLPTISVLDNVVMPMALAGRYNRRERIARAMDLLEQVGIAEHAKKPPPAVSGGQQQRVAIARALANDPPLLVADEPTGSLDSHTASEVLDLFQKLVERGRTVVMVTHDRDIQRRATRAIVLADGALRGDVRFPITAPQERHKTCLGPD